MKRIYQEVLKEHFKENRQMVFLIGPRQVGKTTAAQLFAEVTSDFYYFNWDNTDDRQTILEGPKTVATTANLDALRAEKSLIIFDEIHKYDQWKNFLKGFFDLYGSIVHIIVTGSARLDVLHKGGDSLMGRYFPYRIHPFSVAELLDPKIGKGEIRKPKKLSNHAFQTLWQFGGFPEPYLKAKATFYHRWKKLRLKQLIQDDIQSLSQIQHLDRLEVLAELLRLQAGQLTTFQSLSSKLRVSGATIRNWLSVLKNLYYCFEIRPWTKNISRSLLKEPKYYLWDWGWCEDEGARAENFIACHLLKAVHFWTDQGYGDYHLFFLRDKEKREVDFLISKNHQPWFLVEVKNGDNKAISPWLHYFFEKLKPKHAFQVAINMPYVQKDCFLEKRPLIVPASTFLSQLV